MNEDRMKILNMLEEGKITVEEAAALLEAMDDNISAQEIRNELTHHLRTESNDSQEVSPQGLAAWLKQLLGLGSRKKYKEIEDWTLDRNDITVITTQTHNGNVSYVGMKNHKQISIYAYKEVKAPSLEQAQEFASQIQIHVQPEGGNLRVYAEHPKPPKRVSVTLSYEIHGPDQISVDGHSKNGNVQFEQVEGAVQAKSHNGDIKLYTVAGSMQAETHNGNVKTKALTLQENSEFSSHNGNVKIDVQGGDGPITATTDNGNVNLILPTEYIGNIDAKTHNGVVHSDFQLQLQKFSRNHLVGQLGQANDTPLKLRSHNGNVTLAVQPA